MLSWLHAHESVLWWLGALSVITFIGSLIVIPLLVVRIPEDYFLYDKPRPVWLYRQHPTLRLCLLCLKNVAGIIFIVAGLAMLVLPGQGIITILIGIIFINFPGKRALERRMIQQPSVFRAVNWIRMKASRPPLQLPPFCIFCMRRQEFE